MPAATQAPPHPLHPDLVKKAEDLLKKFEEILREFPVDESDTVRFAESNAPYRNDAVLYFKGSKLRPKGVLVPGQRMLSMDEDEKPEPAGFHPAMTTGPNSQESVLEAYLNVYRLVTPEDRKRMQERRDAIAADRRANDGIRVETATTGDLVGRTAESLQGDPELQAMFYEAAAKLARSRSEAAKAKK